MDKRKKILTITFLLSLLLHIGFFWLLQQQGWLVYTPTAESAPPEEVTIVFPENKPQPKKPREVVQNQNETEEVPDRADYLSDKNSRARNEQVTSQRGSSPNSRGNVPLNNLSPTPSSKINRTFRPRTFNKNALRGSSAKTPTEEYREQQSKAASAKAEGSNQMLDNQKFSVEELGAMTLSTYKWQWAPYINSMKDKLYRVWFPPTAYYQLGLIHGYTVIKYTISREGKILGMTVLDHQGHESLKVSSTQAIEALFPFLPLPKDFPDETLTITAKLIYPDLRRRR